MLQRKYFDKRWRKNKKIHGLVYVLDEQKMRSAENVHNYRANAKSWIRCWSALARLSTPCFSVKILYNYGLMVLFLALICIPRLCILAAWSAMLRHAACIPYFRAPPPVWSIVINCWRRMEDDGSIPCTVRICILPRAAVPARWLCGWVVWPRHKETTRHESSKITKIISKTLQSSEPSFVNF
jgi:hypothetical protein